MIVPSSKKALKTDELNQKYLKLTNNFLVDCGWEEVCQKIIKTKIQSKNHIAFRTQTQFKKNNKLKFKYH